MLTTIRLQNFRCFKDHSVPIRSCAVVVGKNNAGKSTLVDALRLVSIASSRFLNLGIRQAPDWGNIPKRDVGVAPSIEGMGFNTANLFYRYGRPPAIITATFSSRGKLKIYVGEDGILHAVLIDPTTKVVKTIAAARAAQLLSRVEIMPQVAPVETTEEILRPDYVRRNLSSTLAPRHFRNQLNLLSEHLPVFRQVAENTWPGLQVRELTGQGGRVGSELELLVRNEDYVAELATMGHGLQMWLQTMWFIARIERDATLILDEPDVYMHPDLQRRLIRYLKSDRRQVVVTTHSVEIMSEANPEDILVLDRQHPQSSYASTFPAAQQVLEHVGSAHNLQLARLWHARRALFVEGADLKILERVFDLMFPDDRDGLASVPSMSLGGWGGWQYAIGSSLLLQNSGGADIVVYCLLDSDFHTESQKRARYEQASRANVQLHIWGKKEIENYLLIPSVILRCIEQRLEVDVQPPTIDDIVTVLTDAADSLRDETFDGLACEFLADNRALGSAGANGLARERLEGLWSEVDAKLSVVSGKAVLSRLSGWAQQRFGISLNAVRLAAAMRVGEIPDEMRTILRAIASGTAL